MWVVIKGLVRAKGLFNYRRRTVADDGWLSFFRKSFAGKPKNNIHDKQN